jgi:hypothetical protein
VVGRNGGPLHGMWCVTEAKNDQQKKNTACEHTIARRRSAENLNTYTQGKLNRYMAIWQAWFFVFNTTMVYNIVHKTRHFSIEAVLIEYGKVKLS